jgi:type IV pilus assembly protein PilM
MLSSILGHKTKTIVGIDIGSHAVKAVVLERNGEQYRLVHAQQEHIPKGAMTDREIQDIEVVGKVISKIKRLLPKTIKLAAAAVSGSTVITKTIYMDIGLSDSEMESQIEIEADSTIPYPLEEVSLDFERTGVNESDPSKVNVLLSAARNDSVQGRAEAIETSGLTAKVMDVETYALARAAQLIYSQLPEKAENKLVGVIDIGANMTLLTVVKNSEAIYTRDQAFGGEQYTKSIVNYYGKTFEEAELAKISGDLPPNYTFEVLAPFQTSVIQQIRRAVQMFLTSSDNEKLDYLVISGGSAPLEGMKQVIEDELGIPCTIANPFNGMEIGTNVDPNIVKDQASSFMIASGLALRSFDSCHI